MNLRTAIELTMSDGHEPDLGDVQEALLELGRHLRECEALYDYCEKGARQCFLVAHMGLSDPRVLLEALTLTHDLEAWLSECFRDEHSPRDQAERMVFEKGREFARDMHPDNLRALCNAVHDWDRVNEGHEDDQWEACVDNAKKAARAAIAAIDCFLDRVRANLPEDKQ